jgi:replicative DNA helicase
MIDILSDEYTLLLLKACFDKQDIFEVIHQHIKPTYFSRAEQSKLWKEMVFKKRQTGKLPSLPIFIQNFKKDTEVSELLLDIKETEISDHDEILSHFDSFVKNLKFLELYDSVGTDYDRGKREKAISDFIAKAEELSKFSIKANYFEKVFGNFQDRNTDRVIEASVEVSPKIPFGIHHIDLDTKGGAEPGEIVLVAAESGVGKTKYLVHAGITASRSGKAVAHFQLEGTKKQCFNNYDAAWTATLYHDMKIGFIPKSKQDKLDKIIKNFRNSDIHVIAPEKFGGITIPDIRQAIKDLNKITKIGAVVIDYFELIQVGDGIQYRPSEERHRQEKIGQALKEIAMEFNIVIYTATQASNIPKEFKEDENFVITRDDLSEFKGKLRPFDYFFTFNQSRNEKRQKILRIFKDKMREHDGSVWGDVVTIATKYEYSRFYDKKRSLELFAETKLKLEMEDDEEA